MAESIIGEILGEVFVRVLWEGVKLLGALTRICFKRKLTLEAASSKENNGILGLFVLIFFAAIIFTAVYYF